jgi:hypothetical protein
MEALFWRAKQLAEKFSGSPCSIILVIPTPNAAEESAIRENARTASNLNHGKQQWGGCMW